ncbi:FecR family protein [Parapedobacter pyrenivorans]|uniref:FecR family protein n=1 Tax=Parapedobacter pyrenivorans TaxID=1305674 RepID=UPI003342A2F0
MGNPGNSDVLFEKYLSGACTPAEIESLFQRFGVDADEGTLRRLIQNALLDEENANPLLGPQVTAFTERVGDRLSKEISQQHSIEAPILTWHLRKWRTVAAVLVAFLSLGTLGYFLMEKNRQQVVQATSKYGGEVLPGGNRATLTLADGRTVELNANQEGIVVGDEITYDNGTLVLEQGVADKKLGQEDEQTALAVEDLQLTTPKGGQYQITLPDGSRVWLNSASTLRYPSRFDNKERVVELEGEAYFEISEQKIPFLVHTQRQIVEVLGTRFNISAYLDDEETKTTLVVGSVQVAAVGQRDSRLLRPNQQATLHGTVLSVKEVDVDTYIDWKNGLFSFQETSLQDAMSQLSRWYDLEVTYDGNVPSTYFFGRIRRDNSLSNVLKILQKSGLNFRITNEGGKNRLIVLP